MQQTRLFPLTLCLLLLLVLAPGCPDRQQSGVRTDSPDILSEIERKVFDQINEYRRSEGLSALAVSEPIVREARTHSRNMGNGTVPFGHEGFNDRVKATSISNRSAAENVAYNKGYEDPATTAVNGWLKSPGHLKNIRGNFDLTGIGVVKNQEGSYYFTQIFMQTGQAAPQQPQQQPGQPPQQQPGWDWSWLKFW